MFHSSTSFSMDLGCPLLRGSSVRRLRRRATTGGLLKVNNEGCKIVVKRRRFWTSVKTSKKI